MDVSSGPVQGPSAADLYAQVRCEGAAACGCSLGFDTSFCEGFVQRQFVVWQRAMAPARFDLDCFAEVLEAFTTMGCLTAVELAAAQAEPECVVFAGEKGRGVSCESGGGSSARADDCAPPLQCRPTVSGPQCLLLEDYTRSQPGLEAACALESVAGVACQQGLYCDLSGSQLCQPKGAAGDTCRQLDACASGLWCDSITTVSEPACAPVGLRGDACITSSSCAAPSVCAAGTCDDEATPRACFLIDL